MTSSAPRSFRSAAAFRVWLARHHASATELVVRLYRKEFAARGMTYAEALDEALCFGWIDGVRRSLDEVSFTIRFSPRKARSIWSNVNARHVERLTREGRMAASGLAAWEARDAARVGVYSFERAAAAFPPPLLRRFRLAHAAWAFFEAQPPGYRRTVTHWVVSAKREETRLQRLTTLIDRSAKGERLL